MITNFNFSFSLVFYLIVSIPNILSENEVPSGQTQSGETEHSLHVTSYFSGLWNTLKDIVFDDTTEIKCSTPANFPSSISLVQQKYGNWAQAIKVPNLWKAIPKSPEDVVLLANYAAANNKILRAMGFMHTWSPTTVVANSSCENIILVDTKKYLNKMSMQLSPEVGKSSVRVQTGASMDDLLDYLEKNGFGFLATPAPGDITIGGVVAIDGHGTGIPKAGEKLKPGHTYGSISNLVLEFTAVVYNSTTDSYKLKTFSRVDREAKAFLTNLGRTIITEVVLRVGLNNNLRCVSKTDISVTELFMNPESEKESLNNNTFARLLENSGRMEIILFPFTTEPWIKIWTVSPNKTRESKEVSLSYNYPFTDNIPKSMATMADRIINGEWNQAKEFGRISYDAVDLGLTLTNSRDIWGPSKNLLLYIKPTTMRVTANGFVVITQRKNIQNVVSKMYWQFDKMLKEYANRNEYPVNNPLEIRVTGLDNPDDILLEGAEAPSLSAIRPPYRPSYDFDVAIWVDVLTFPTTPKSNQFYKEYESYIFTTFNKENGDSIVRVEWSKGWAYTDYAPWSNQEILQKNIPNSFSAPESGWFWTLSVLANYDKKNIYTNSFLNSFLTQE